MKPTLLLAIAIALAACGRSPTAPRGYDPNQDGDDICTLEWTNAVEYQGQRIPITAKYNMPCADTTAWRETYGRGPGAAKTGG
jgi:hypothetical protein